ncbi:hypothetical protein VYU27_010689, partial [Nannochloropsis oceanica]
APAAHAEALGWLTSAVADFGVGHCGVQSLCSFAISELEGASNPVVRKAAVELLGEVYKQAGPPVKALACPESLKAGKAAVEAEFERVGFHPSTAALKKVKGESSGGTGGGGGGSSGGGGGGLGLPRLDLTAQEKDLVGRLSCMEGKLAWQ